MACTCQACGTPYRIDVMVHDNLWEEIKPTGSATGGGLLCPACIFKVLDNMWDYSAWKLEFNSLGKRTCQPKMKRS